MENGFNSRNQQISFTLNIAEAMGDVIYFTQLQTPNFKNIQAGNACQMSAQKHRKQGPLHLALPDPGEDWFIQGSGSRWRLGLGEF